MNPRERAAVAIARAAQTWFDVYSGDNADDLLSVLARLEMMLLIPIKAERLTKGMRVAVEPRHQDTNVELLLLEEVEISRYERKAIEGGGWSNPFVICRFLKYPNDDEWAATRSWEADQTVYVSALHDSEEETE